MTVRTLRATNTVEAKLPMGPTNKFVYDKEADAKLDKHELYDAFLNRMEEEMASLLCVDRSSKKNEWGRQDGPSFVVRNAISDNDVGGETNHCGVQSLEEIRTVAQ